MIGMRMEHAHHLEPALARRSFGAEKPLGGDDVAPFLSRGRRVGDSLDRLDPAAARVVAPDEQTAALLGVRALEVAANRLAAGCGEEQRHAGESTASDERRRNDSSEGPTLPAARSAEHRRNGGSEGSTLPAVRPTSVREARDGGAASGCSGADAG